MGSMYMSGMLLTQDLLSTGYKKYWNVDKDIAEMPTGCGKISQSTFRQRSQSCGAPNRERRRVDFQDSGMVVVDGKEESSNTNFNKKVMVRINNSTNNTSDKGGGRYGNSGFARLDMKTLQNIGWGSNANDGTKPDTVTEAEAFYKLSKVEFRKLQEQVRDVSMNLKNRFRTSAYQLPPRDKSGSKRPNGETTNQVYRSQLDASLKAFQQKQWPPLNRQELDPKFLRCKPLQQTNERPQTSCSLRTGVPFRLQRPKSVPASSLRPKSSIIRRCDTSDVRPGKFDTLSPLVISDLMGNPPERPTSDYEGSPDDKSPLIDVIAAETKRLIENDNDDASTTSGIDSGASENESPSEEEDSEYEPDIDPNIYIPQLNLRPEKLDAIYIPEPKRGWRQYDFDMSNIDEPPYEFKNPFPDLEKQIDLKKIAKEKLNWRNELRTKTTVRDPNLDEIIDRLVEFEKLQLDTIDWENKRAVQIKKSAFKRNTSAKIKDKRCDTQCLQATCFGDCPERLAQTSCEYCRQGFCTGNCKEVKYEERMRQPRSEEERPLPPKSPFPRACSTCQRKHNAKFINANNLILGSQRINNATFTRGQGSAKARDLRPKTPSTFPNDIVKEFEKLNINTTQSQRPSTSMSITSRPRSRNAIYPGKSFSSQRKNSLTDLDKIASRKKKTKPASRTKRPKTAG